MTADALTAELAAVIAADPSVPTGVLMGTASPRLGLLGVDVTSFSSLPFRTYRRVWGADWAAPGGRFEGEVRLTVRGERAYHYAPDPAAPFAFVRPCGERIEPGPLVMDGGSVPRVVWCVPGFDPWTYMAAYLVHDWMFARHRTDPDCPWSFAAANAVLAEAMYAMMVTGYGDVAENWQRVAAVLAAVSSPAGRRAWDSR